MLENGSLIKVSMVFGKPPRSNNHQTCLSNPCPWLNNVPTVNLKNECSHEWELTDKKHKVNSQHILCMLKSLLINLFILTFGLYEIVFKSLIIPDRSIIFLHLGRVDFDALCLELIEVQLWVQSCLLLHDVEILSQNQVLSNGHCGVDAFRETH